MPIPAILIKNQSARFIPLMIEKDHSWRPPIGSGHNLPINYSGMLSFSIRNDHSKFPVLLYDVDTFNIDFLKLLPLVLLIGERGK